MNKYPINWSRLVLSDLQINQWRGESYLYKLVGIVGSWRESSWLLQWGESIGAVLISLILTLAPFVSNNLLGMLLGLVGVYWMLLTIADRGQTFVTPIHLLVILYWAIVTVAVAFSPVKAEAFHGWLKLTLYLAMFFLSARVLQSPRLLSIVITVFLHVALIVGAYGVRQQFFGVQQLATWNDPSSVLANDTRVYSYLENPNLLAAYLLPAIALSIAAFFVWRGWLPKALALTMVVVDSACLYFTDSRGGWIGLVGLLALFFLMLQYWWRDYLPPFWRTWLLPLVFGSFAAVLVVSIIFVEPLRLRFFSIFAGREDSSNNFRINVWDSVLQMIADRPILGIGPGNEAFNKIYPIYMKPKFTALSAYSIYLETAVESGLIGLSCFLWFLTVTFSQGVRLLSQCRQQQNPQGFWLMAAIAGMTGLLIHGFTDTVWYRPQVNTLWWLMVAIIASFYNRFRIIDN
jgi:putative inorganic carbon (HCO3(-)) transporter